MAKDYFCKDCGENNNGWCKKRGIQGLKSITECADKPNNNPKIESSKDLKDVKDGAYKQFGKREMFYNIQRQMSAIEADSTIEDKFILVKQVMVSFETMLQIEEEIHGIALDYLIDQDIHEDSKKLSQKWFMEVGTYRSDK